MGRLSHLIRHPLRRIVLIFMSEHAVRAVTVIAGLVTIIGLPFAVYQLWDLRDQRANRSMQVLMMVDQQLNSEVNVAIRHAILDHRPLLKPGGTFTENELSDYLDTLEVLAFHFERKLVDLDSIDDWYGETIDTTYRNDEVQAYIRKQQKDGPDYWNGFMELGKRLSVPEGKAPSSLRAAPQAVGAPKQPDAGGTTMAVFFDWKNPFLYVAVIWAFVYARYSVRTYVTLEQRSRDQARRDNRLPDLPPVTYPLAWWVYQWIFNGLGSFIGWMAAYFLLWNTDLHKLGFEHFVALIIAYLGITGNLPQVSIAGSIFRRQ
jgi:hypothetical protein